MKKIFNKKNKLRFNIFLIALIFGVLSWIGDAIIDYFFFFDTKFQNVLLLHLSPHMQFERIMVTLTFVVFGIIIGAFVIKQKEAEELEIQHQVLKTTIDSLTHPFYVVDINDYSVVLANIATKKFISEINPKCYAITHRRDTPCGGGEHHCPLETVKETGKATVVEHTHYDDHGNEYIFEVHGHPIFDESGNVIQMIEYSIDITERKKLERKLIHRTIELRSLIDQSPSPISVYSGSGQLLEFNNQWKTFFDVNDAPVYQNILENENLIENGYISRIENTIKNGGGIKTEPIFFENTKKRVIFNIYTIKDDSGSVYRIVCQIEDITEELRRTSMNKELELQKKLSAAILENLEAERKRVSKELHDQIGQKLLLAKLAVEMIEDNSKSEKFTLKDVKNQILDVSKDIKAVIFSLHPAELENYGLSDAIDLMLKKFTDLTGIKTNFIHQGKHFRLDKKTELNIYRIVQEAINNISKHSKASKAEVVLIFSSELISVTVKDDGIGFLVDDLSKNGNSANKFGLMSMLERTKISGGEFNINSQPGKGTEIKFNIPNTVLQQ